jgi:YfiR/HmsC-like
MEKADYNGQNGVTNVHAPRVSTLHAIALACLLCMGVRVSPAVEMQPATREQQIKAAFIYNFTKFVEWPSASFESKVDPIVIGVLEQTPLTAELEFAVQDRRVNGRGILVRKVSSVEEIKRVQVLYVGAGEDSRYAALASPVQGSAVLTIGESSAFAAAGGIINFILDGDKVHFEINMRSAELAHLKVSAQLQKLATSVLRSP